MPLFTLIFRTFAENLQTHLICSSLSFLSILLKVYKLRIKFIYQFLYINYVKGHFGYFRKTRIIQINLPKQKHVDS